MRANGSDDSFGGGGVYKSLFPSADSLSMRLRR